MTAFRMRYITLHAPMLNALNKSQCIKILCFPLYIVILYNHVETECILMTLEKMHQNKHGRLSVS